MNESERILQRRVADMVKGVQHSGVSRTIGFLSEREKELALAALNKQRCDEYVFEGGYPGAERVMLCVFADKERLAFPLVAASLLCSGRGAENLTHRDYLGAILAAGIERTCVGDILVLAGGATVFLQQSIFDFVKRELREVGRFAVSVQQEEAPAITALEPSQKQPVFTSVASLRVDAVLAAMLGLSRTKAAALVTQGLVQVNHLPVDAVHHTVGEGDVFSIRGTGKLCLCGVGGRSKKNRIRIEFIHY